MPLPTIILKNHIKQLIEPPHLQKAEMSNNNNEDDTLNNHQQSLITQEPEQERPLEGQIPALQKKEKRPFIKRAFGKMQEGSMRGMMFALMASAMGTGIFNLPLRCDQIGLIPFVMYVVAAALFSFLGMYMITLARVRLDVESYGDMTMKTFGRPLKFLAEFCLILYPWGITVCFQVIFAKFVIQLLNDYCGLDLYEDRRNEVYNDFGNYLRIGVNVAGILLNFFFILKKNIGILQKLAMVGVSAVVFNAFVIIITSMTGFTRKISDDYILDYHGIFQLPSDVHVNWFSTGSLEDASRHFQGLASVIFCYVNHQLIFPLSSSLARPTKNRLFRIFRRVNISEGTIYTLIGVLSYLLLLEHDKAYPIEPMVLTSIPTTFMAIGKLGMVFALFFAVPLNLFPCRETFYQAFNMARSNRNHYILSILLALCGCLVAIAFQKVNSYFGLLGGTAGVLMAGGIPALCYFKARSKLTWVDILMLVFCFLVVCGGFAGAILSVVDPA